MTVIWKEIYSNAIINLLTDTAVFLAELATLVLLVYAIIWLFLFYLIIIWLVILYV